jgi:NADH-quinone oxidoreductase subunit G
MPDGGNSVAASLAGVLPHRTLGGRAAQPAGLNVADMFAGRLKSYILLGAIEPGLDIASPAALEALKSAECVIAMTPYGTAKEFAHVILPIGTFAETSGTYVNLEGRWQSVPGAAAPVGEARPAWKVLRVLGNLLNLPDFDYTSSDQITDEVRKQLEAAPAFALKASARTLQSKLALGAAAGEGSVSRDVPIYSVDAMVRRSSALQATSEARGAPRGGRS